MKRLRIFGIIVFVMVLAVPSMVMSGPPGPPGTDGLDVNVVNPPSEPIPVEPAVPKTHMGVVPTKHVMLRMVTGYDEGGPCSNSRPFGQFNPYATGQYPVPFVVPEGYYFIITDIQWRNNKAINFQEAEDRRVGVVLSRGNAEDGYEKIYETYSYKTFAGSEHLTSGLIVNAENYVCGNESYFEAGGPPVEGTPWFNTDEQSMYVQGYLYKLPTGGGVILSE